MLKANGHAWRFKARFRRHVFGWKSQPPIARLREAVSEIRQVARSEPMLAAEGAVALLERISPAFENVDSSSGAIGTAVNNTIAELVPIRVAAPADATIRATWLERLFEAHGADQIPYIERLADYWGELCGSIEIASAWARLWPTQKVAATRGRAIETSMGCANRSCCPLVKATRPMLATASPQTEQVLFSDGFGRWRRNTRTSHAAASFQIWFG